MVHWVGDNIQPSHFLLPSSPPTLNLSQHLGLFQWVGSLHHRGFPCGSADKESAHNVEYLGLIPGLGRSPGEGKGYPLQYSGLENSMDCILHGVSKSQTRLSNFHLTSHHMVAKVLQLQLQFQLQQSVLPMNIQGWFSLGSTGLTSLQSKGLPRVFSNTMIQKHQFFGSQSSLWSNSHIRTWLQKTVVLTIWTFVGKVVSVF